MPWRQAYALRRDQVNVRIVRFGQVSVHRVHDRVGCMRAGDGEHFRVGFAHDVALGAKAAGDDDAAVFAECFADGVE